MASSALHHAVYHAKKPTKIKVVFECSAVFWACRFIVNYYDQFAVQSYIELMFYQVILLKKDIVCLKSFCWKDGNLDVEHKQFRIKVLLGNSISPTERWWMAGAFEWPFNSFKLSKIFSPDTRVKSLTFVITSHEIDKKWRTKIMLTGRVCGDIYCHPFTYCRRRQILSVLSAHIVILEHILSQATLYADMDTFS